MIPLYLVVTETVAISILSFIGKFCISAAWQIIIVWQTEVYPTTLRCTLSALNGVVGRIGLVTAPYMVDLVSCVMLQFKCLKGCESGLKSMKQMYKNNGGHITLRNIFLT